MTDRNQLKVQLRNLREWREAYYNGSALVTDAVYDDVEDQVRAAAKDLDDTDKLKLEIEEFLAGVGAAVVDDAAVDPTSKWTKVKHKQPMGSLNKAQTGDEVTDWLMKSLAKLGGVSVNGVWSDKCDGISVGLDYEDGKLVRAATRGDGEIGEDITRNVMKMQGVVPFIKGFTGFIRGEIVLRKSDWQAHFPGYANPRNAASGIAKRYDGQGVEHLTVLHYKMVRATGKALPNKLAEFKVMAHLGCGMPSFGPFTSLDDITALYKRYVDGDREALDYDIDGLVLEFNDPEHMETLGEHNLRPRGGIAYKFPHDKKVSVLRGVEWQVGNSGRITPVAVFDKVNLAGANVTNASLHNISNIDRLVAAVGQDSLFEGDQIVVSRRNDVIPYVEEVLQTNVLADAQSDPNYEPPVLEVPKVCPVCGTDLTREGEFLVCPNDEQCPAQIAGSIKVWVKKLGLKGVGTSLIDSLCDQGILKDAADLYKLDEGELSAVQMDGRRVGGTARIVCDAIYSKMDLPIHVFVGSLNISLCSRSTVKTIADAGYDTLDKMRTATVAQIASIPGMGTGRAEAFVGGLKSKSDLIDRLLANGVTIQAPATGAFKGLTVCMTGFRDADMTSAIESQGGTVKSGVSKNLSILVAKDPKSTSGKAKKARSYGVEVIGQDEMWNRLGGRP